MLNAFWRLVEMSGGSSAPRVERDARILTGAGPARRRDPAQATFAWHAAEVAGTARRHGK